MSTCLHSFSKHLSWLLLALSLTHHLNAADFAQKAQWISDGLVSSVMQENNISGLTLSIVKDGKIIVAKGYGYATLEPQTEVDPKRSLFRIGSLSKTFTWTAIMQLVEAGKLDLHTDINTYLNTDLNGFEIPQTFDKPLTLNDMMAHRSGFEDGGAGYLFKRKADQVVSLQQLLAEHIPAQVWPPGETVSYSNYATALAGRIVENVSGMSFDDYLEKNIFEPLGMLHTTFREPLGVTNVAAISKELEQDLISGFNLSAGRHIDHGFEFVHQLGPAGSGSSTAQDMGYYMLAHLNKGELNGQRILKASTAEQMRKRNFNDRLEMTGFAHGFFNGNIEGHEYFGHGGALSTYKTMMKIFPDLQFGVFISINQGPGTAAVYNIPELLVKSLFESKQSLESVKPSQEFSDIGKKYIGSYLANRRAYSKLEKIFSLVDSIADINIDAAGYLVRVQNGQVSSWVELSPGLFRNAESQDVMKFDFDAEGKVLRMNLEAGHTSMDKISFSQSPNFLFMSLILSVLFSVSTLIGFYAQDKNPNNQDNKADRIGQMAAIASILLLIDFLVVSSSLGIADFYVWPSMAVKSMIWMSLLASLSYLVMTANLLRVWQSTWPLMRKLNRTLFAMFALMTVYALWQWNLLGFYY